MDEAVKRAASLVTEIAILADRYSGPIHSSEGQSQIRARLEGARQDFKSIREKTSELMRLLSGAEHS